MSMGAVDIVFLDDNNGWLVSTFCIFTTADGGDTWLLVFPESGSAKWNPKGQPTSISAVSESAAWLGFTDGEVWNTNDRGKSWQKFDMPLEADPNTIRAGFDVSSIYALNNDQVWVGPGSGGSDGLYHTEDGGKNWKQQLTDPIRTNFCQTSMSFPEPGVGWVSGSEFVSDPSSPKPTEGATFVTMNGRTWKRLNDPSFEIPFQKVIFADSLNGWLIGTDYQENQSYVYRSDDGGNTWRKVFELERPKRDDRLHRSQWHCKMKFSIYRKDLNQ